LQFDCVTAKDNCNDFDHMTIVILGEGHGDLSDGGFRDFFDCVKREKEEERESEGRGGEFPFEEQEFPFEEQNFIPMLAGVKLVCQLPMRVEHQRKHHEVMFASCMLHS